MTLVHTRKIVPPEWETVQDLWLTFVGYGAVMSGYRLTWLHTQVGEDTYEVKCSLTRSNPVRRLEERRKYESLVASKHPVQVEAALRMLISEVQARGKTQWWDNDDVFNVRS